MLAKLLASSVILKNAKSKTITQSGKSQSQCEYVSHFFAGHIVDSSREYLVFYPDMKFLTKVGNCK
jgi:hypothetical protein